MKVFALAVVLGLFVALAACTSANSSSATDTRGTELGNSGIRASGYLETGGTLRSH